MTEPYVILSEDIYNAVHKYIKKAIKNPSSNLYGIADAASKDFTSLPSKFGTKKSGNLKTWCQRNLSLTQWEEMMQSIFPQEKKVIV